MLSIAQRRLQCIRPTHVRAFASQAELKQTPLYEFHKRHGGKMVPFAGWSMPVQYASQTLMDAHKHVRSSAGLFDVSHMLQFIVSGPGATAFLESVTPADLKGLGNNYSTLSVFTNKDGGIIDDTVVCKHSDTEFYVVSNAACADKDLAHLRSQLSQWSGDKVELETMDNYGLVALQGPKAVSVLSQLVKDDLSQFKFMQARDLEILGTKMHVARAGYTGEDGFEISVPPQDGKTEELAETFLKSEAVELAGLGPRDSLRLEAGMCLYGHDLDDTTSPVEGGLSWVIGKRRRTEGGFLGSERVLRELKEGVSRRRVGFIVDGAPAREGAEIFTADGSESLGNITSGSPSPSVGKNIAMGYIKNGHHKSNTEVAVKVRNRMQKGVVTKMPFTKANYFR